MIDDFNLTISPEELLATNDEMKAYLLKTEGHIVIPYIIDLMKDLHKHGLKLYIASSSPTAAIEEVMETLKIKKYFEGFVSGAMVTLPKPAPDIFRAAADRLGVPPGECIVIEDSCHGVTAAEAAGMTSIGFINPNSGSQDLRKATMLVESFEEVDYEFIDRVYQYAHMEPVTILNTEHFIIRELAVDDIDELINICKDPDINRFMEGFDDIPEVEKEKLRAYIENMYHFYGFGLWGVFFKDDGLLAGRCGIELKRVEDEEIYEIGYLLAKPYQGRGFAREFVLGVLDYCFRKLEIKRVIAIIDKDNARSIRLAEQVGMKRNGESFRYGRSCYRYEITYPDEIS
jgi:HAD superfamily hydrolase (TIGR01509 family)